MRCVKCGLPDTYETIEFNSVGICNICEQSVHKLEVIDWEERYKQLVSLVESYRGTSDYDCIIPFSGGKDSTFTLLYLVKNFNIKPLVVQFNHGFMRPNLLENNERTFKKLGVDVISFTPNWRIVRELMYQSLFRKGDFCWHCHTGIFSYPMQIAVKFKIPLLFWGEPSTDYTAYYDVKSNTLEEVDEVRFNRFINLGITADDMLGMIAKKIDVSSRDLNPYRYPHIDSLKEIGYRSVCLGSYIPWDTKTQAAIIKEELGWRGDEVEGVPQDLYDYEKIECHMQGMRDYIKYLKRGYGRTRQLTAMDVRRGLILLEEADNMVGKYDGKVPATLPIFLEYLKISEAEFYELVSRTAVLDEMVDYRELKPGIKPHDFNRIYREK